MSIDRAHRSSEISSKGVGHDVIGMEQYVAEGSKPLDRCLADVALADLYVLILAWRYGFWRSQRNRARPLCSGQPARTAPGGAARRLNRRGSRPSVASRRVFGRMPIERWSTEAAPATVERQRRVVVNVVDRDAFALGIAREWVQSGLPRTRIR